MEEMFYETSDQYEMAILASKGFPYDLNKDNPKRIVAIFEGNARLMSDIVERYWDYKERVDARTLLESFTAFKRSFWRDNKYDPTYYDAKKTLGGDKKLRKDDHGTEKDV